MFGTLLKLFSFQNPFSTQCNLKIEDLVLTRFIESFGEESTIDNWMRNRNIKELCALDLFKEVIGDVRDVLSVINQERYSMVKSMIMDTNMSLPKLGYPYFKTFNIIDSVQRIININEDCKLDANNLHKFEKEFLFKEYDMMYYKLELTIINVGLEFNFIDTIESFMEWGNSRLSKTFKFINAFCVTKNLYSTLDLIKRSNSMLESILPLNFKTIVNIEADSEGFGSSKKCSNDKINFFIRENFSNVVLNNMTYHAMKCIKKLSWQNRVNIKDFTDRKFICNRVISKILIVLFYYYSEIKNVNTTYEVIFHKNDEYLILWSFSGKPPIKKIKEYWLQQEILNLQSRKRIPKFGFIIKYDEEYSTIKSDNTLEDPIETRLILLSCGHQLGFELIDEFLEHYYIKYSEPLMCHICRQQISILGSYNTEVYRCK